MITQPSLAFQSVPEMAYNCLYNVHKKKKKTRVARMLSGRKAARGASYREREARTREPGPEKSQKSSGGIGFAGQSVLARPRTTERGSHRCVLRARTCAREGILPELSLLCLFVGRSAPNPPTASLHSSPTPSFFAHESFGAPTTDRSRGRSRAAGYVLPMGPWGGDMWCTVTSHSDGGVEGRTSQLETSFW